MFSRKYPIEIQETWQNVNLISHRSIIMKHMTKIIFGDVLHQNNIVKIKYLLICTTQKNFILSLK